MPSCTLRHAELQQSSVQQPDELLNGADEGKYLFVDIRATCTGEPAAQSRQWDDQVLGRSKRAVLSDIVLPIVMSSTALSKVAVDFSERLQAANAASSAPH